MGRPSVQTERHEQIMQAAARCVVSHGLSALTLDKIAQEAGMARGHIRHYAGNRDQLVLALAQWIFQTTDAELNANITRASPNGIAALLDYLFGEAFSAPSDESIVIVEFLNAARNNAQLRTTMLAGYDATRETIYASLRAEFVGADETALRNCAYSLLSLTLGNALLSDLAGSSQSDDLVRAAANQLLTPFQRQ